MSYEENAKAIISCISSCAFAFIAMGALDSYLFMMIAAANTLKPSDPLSLMWNVVFMGMAFSALALTFRVQTMLFFPDTVRNSMKEDSEMTTYMLLPGKSDVKIMTNSQTGMATVATMILKLTQETNTDAATTKESTTQIPTTEVCAECPGTPDSEISRADTVKCEKMAKE